MKIILILLLYFLSSEKIRSQTIDNAKIIKDFYESFTAANIETMVSCYDTSIVFKDPIFGELKADKVKNMWSMLINNSNDKIAISVNTIVVNEKKGTANWTANYIFYATGRKITNKVLASFEFKDGKIVKHTDTFNLWKWSRQAFGLTGYLFGWTKFMKTKIRHRANSSLELYISTLK